MIPLKLRLKNFLSYGDSDQEINFEPYSLICLSGKNGHGKSAILDGITWSLWGQARKVSGVSRADEALIRLGQNEMCVVFEFFCNGQRYTVRRELSFFYGKTKISLEFGYVRDGESKIVSLTEKTIRLTQDRIEAAIGLDFGTFTSSVFLRQGQSNEFSKKSAKERKDVLASILGLDYYDQLRRYAMDMARELSTEVDYLKANQQQIKIALEKMDDLRQQVIAVKQNFQEIEAQENLLLQQQKDIKTFRESLFQKRERLFTLDKQRAQIQEAIHKYKYAHELKFEKQSKELEIFAARLHSKKEALSDQGKSLILQKNKIDAVLVDLERQDAICAKAVSKKKEMEIAFRAAQRLFEKRKELYHRMVGYGNWINQELHNIKNHDLKKVQSNEPICPLCERQLSSDGRFFLEKKLDKKYHFHEHRFARISGFIIDSKSILFEEHKKIDLLNSQLQNVSQYAARKKEIEEKYGVVKRDATEILLLLKKLENEQKVVAREEEMLFVQKKRYQDEVNNGLSQEVAYRDLVDSLNNIALSCKNLDEEGLKERDHDLKDREVLLEQKFVVLSAQKAHLTHEKGRLEQMVNQCAAMKLEYGEYERKVAFKHAEIDDYKIIISALGKDGIQALLIESVIPEIEDEANRLLSQLSDQNAQIFIESVRDLKSGGAKETLDIKISDNAGIRPYELFSGGEAFRVDFALRIAISTLLARRAGTSLQTLIIDEGFGSQDADGLQLIMDALYKIQDRFAKIIVVSHLPEMKDLFPVHFLIEKTATGSQVSVVEQG